MSTTILINRCQSYCPCLFLFVFTGCLGALRSWLVPLGHCCCWETLTLLLSLSTLVLDGKVHQPRRKGDMKASMEVRRVHHCPQRLDPLRHSCLLLVRTVIIGSWERLPFKASCPKPFYPAIIVTPLRCLLLQRQDTHLIRGNALQWKI